MLLPMRGGRVRIVGTDFSEYTSNLPPSDWTQRWDNNSTLLVVDDVAALGGKKLSMAIGTDWSMDLWSWDKLDGIANGEVLAKVQCAGGSLTNGIKIVVRGSGAAGLGGGHIFALGYETDVASLAKWVDGSFQSIASVGVPTLLVDTWYWMRCSFKGSSLKLKYWADGGNEPADWTVEASDAEFSAGGWIGIQGWRYVDDPKVDFFGVAVGGRVPGP